MEDFKIRRGLKEVLFPFGELNPQLVIEEGCWYLATDTAELYLGITDEEQGGPTLKKINGSASDIPTQLPGTTEGEVVRSIVGAYINEETGELWLIFSDNTEESFGRVVGKDGLTTAIKIGDTVYEHSDGVIELPEIDLSAYAQKTDIPDVSGFATKVELEAAIETIEHPTVDLSDYAKTQFVNKTTVAQKYEVLPIDGMFVSYNGTEIRVNTQHVDIDSLPKQNAGDGSSDSYYYATFRAYAPEEATSVIEGSSDKMDTEHSTLATDQYGRKYTTIWPAIASKSGTTWSKFGDKSNTDKYLGFYYNFHWYNGDKLISKDKVRVILTNDACHNDLVPDAVARRIDEKVTTVNTSINNLNTAVENIENNYVQNETLENYVTNEYIQQQEYITNQYITENYTTTEDLAATYVTNTTLETTVESKVTEVIQEKVDAGEINVNAESIKYDTWD